MSARHAYLLLVAGAFVVMAMVRGVGGASTWADVLGGILLALGCLGADVLDRKRAERDAR